MASPVRIDSFATQVPLSSKISQETFLKEVFYSSFLGALVSLVGILEAKGMAWLRNYASVIMSYSDFLCW